ncbi:MAG TPA: GFA family protein [Gaiellaceae bacterium]|nr:GFA family protein [Gaiellaceae bacterium]
MDDSPALEQHEGGCACAAVRFRIDGPLGSAGWCHCTRCQRRTGSSASPQARVRATDFVVLRGRETISEWAPPSGGFVKAFCSICGSHLYSRSPIDPERMAVRLGAFDGDPGVRPSYHQRIETAAVWQPLPDDGLPRFHGPAPQTTAGE